MAIQPNNFNATKTHCPQGHPYSKENTYVYTRQRGEKVSKLRLCKICTKANARRAYNDIFRYEEVEYIPTRTDPLALYPSLRADEEP